MQTPQASIIIPTFKRPDFIKRCLDRLAPGMQTVSSGSYEVIVADDDPARSAVELLGRDYSWVVATYGPSKGPGGARNCAAAFAKAPLLIFTDDDCIPESTWVEGFLEKHEEDAVLIGKTTCKDGFSDPFEHAPENLEGKEGFSCNFAISREHFHKMGGFDEGYLKYGFEDYDFFRRCDRSGLQRIFAPKAIVDHPARLGPRAAQRIEIKVNEYRYKLKFGLDISLSQQMRVSAGFTKAALKRPGSIARKLEYLFDQVCFMVMLIAYHDRLIRRARASLHTEPSA